MLKSTFYSRFAAAWVLFVAASGCSSCSVVPAPAYPVLSQANINFGSVLLGSRSSQSLTLTNTGGSPLLISGITLTGANAPSFAISDGCGASLAANSACTIQVTFSPSVVGSAVALLNITDNAPSTEQSATLSGTSTNLVTADVIVYGASPSGILASIEAAKLGKNVVSLEPTPILGGMLSNGLGSTDLYGTPLIGGLAEQFFKEVNAAYSSAPSALGGFAFEPHVAESVFKSMLNQYQNIGIFAGALVSSVQMSGSTITSLATRNGLIFQGKEFIDASYTGDLMSAAGVSYSVGRESAAQYAERLAGVGVPAEIVQPPIDAYVEPGNPASGLIAHVTGDNLGIPGSSDAAVMAYNYRLCVTFDPDNQIPFDEPPNYDPAEFELLGRALAHSPQLQLSDLFLFKPLPQNKYDLNNGGLLTPQSTDEVGESYAYPDGSAAIRQQIEQEQVRYTRALMYFLKTDSRVPQKAQAGANELGRCKDEFTGNNGWPYQIYVREARRMIGAYVLTEHDLELETSIPDSIGVGGYPVDCHWVHVVNVNGTVNGEHTGTIQPKPYRIPYRISTPQASQATNLLVSVDVSASHVAYDSLRIEVTYMIMGQAAGAAASLAIDADSTVQAVNYASLSSQLLKDGSVLAPQ